MVDRSSDDRYRTRDTMTQSDDLILQKMQSDFYVKQQKYKKLAQNSFILQDLNNTEKYNVKIGQRIQSKQQAEVCLLFFKFFSN